MWVNDYIALRWCVVHIAILNGVYIYIYTYIYIYIVTMAYKSTNISGGGTTWYWFHSHRARVGSRGAHLPRPSDELRVDTMLIYLQWAWGTQLEIHGTVISMAISYNWP